MANPNYVTSYKTIYDDVTNENDRIANQLNVTTQKDSTAQSKSNYRNIETIKIQGHNYYLFWIYYALIPILAYFLYTKSTLDYKYKIGIVIGFLIYPFVIFPIEMGIYSLFTWLWAIFIGTPYK
jgi:hypothetical protein